MTIHDHDDHGGNSVSKTNVTYHIPRYLISLPKESDQTV